MSFVYHVHATYSKIGSGNTHHFDGLITANGKITTNEQLDISRQGLAEQIAVSVGYTPPADNVVIRSLSFLHEA